MESAISFVACFLSGAIAGIYLSVIIHDFRIKDLNGSAYVAMHQMRDKTYRVVMPLLGLTTLACLVVAMIVTLGHLSSSLFAIAGAFCAIDIVIAVGHQVPLNKQVQAWNAATPPPQWLDVRDRWERGHRCRTLLGVLCFAVCLSSVIAVGSPGTSREQVAFNFRMMMTKYPSMSALGHEG